MTDAANKANLAVLQSSGTVSVTFGFNPAASNTTAWVVKRSLDLLPGSFLEVYRYDGPTDTTTTNIPISVNMTSSSFEVQDLSSPQPTSAFYSLEAELSP